MNSIEHSIKKALTILQIPHTDLFVFGEVREHTEKNTLLCISDVLERYKIETTAGEFENKEELPNYPGLHISQLSTDNQHYFVIVESVTDDRIQYFQGDEKIEESLEEYFKKWSGYVLFFNKTEHSREPNYEENSRLEKQAKLKTPILVAIGIVLFAFVFFATCPELNCTFFSSLLLIKTVGIWLSVLLLSVSMKSGSSLAKKICGLADEAGCVNILHSKAAGLFSFLSWSEVGIIYFSATFLTLVLSEWMHLQAGVYNLITFLSVLALPYTVYSIYYQKVVAKSWCLLCLAIQVVLVVEFLTHWLFGNLSFQTFTTSSILLLLFDTLLITTGWYLIKPSIESKIKLGATEKRLKTFIQNADILKFMFENGKSVAYPIQANAIVLGSSNPVITITLFSSPKCIHCKNAHEIIGQIINRYPSTACNIIFHIGEKNVDEKKKIIAHFLQLRKERTCEETNTIIREWYETDNPSFEKWSLKYPVKGDALKENNQMMALHSQICTRMEIAGTPTVAINGKILPKIYSYTDLEAIVSSLL